MDKRIWDPQGVVEQVDQVSANFLSHDLATLKQEVVDISETVTDRAKRTKIWDPQGIVEQVDVGFGKIFVT